MKNIMELNLTTTNCEITALTHSEILQKLENELKEFPEHSHINLDISKREDSAWSFNLSMRYTRGHVATHKTETSLDQTIKSGMAEFKKNLKTYELQAAIETFHFDRTGEYDYYTEVSTEALALPQRKLSALIVEDDPAAALVLQTTLKAYGCNVDYCDTPTEALDAIIAKRFDLLILDWNLPYMNGSEFLIAADKILKRADAMGKPQRQVPVVICTTLPLEEINLPPVSHFCFYNHWHKGLPFSSVLESMDDVTQKITVRNQRVV